MDRHPVLVIHPANDASAEVYYRRVLPQLEAASGRRWHMKVAAEVGAGELGSYQAVIFMRSRTPAEVGLLFRARREGCLTIYDTDDNLLLLHQMIPDPDNPWRRRSDPLRPLMRAMLREVDLVRLYTPLAVPSFAPLNPQVRVIPPYQDVLGPCEPERPRGPVVVGCFGSPFKDEEFSALTPALLRLLDEGAPVALEFFGFMPAPLAGRKGVSFLPWEPEYDTFRQKLRARRWAIGLGPLRDLEFNRCKNDTKYREYAALSIAGIYSDMPVFRTAVRHQVTGLLVEHDSPDAWCRAILRLVGDEALRQAIVREAYREITARFPVSSYVRELSDLVDAVPAPRRAP